MYNEDYPDLIYEGFVQILNNEIVMEGFNVKEKIIKIFKAIRVALEKIKEQWIKLLNKIRVSLRNIKNKIVGNKKTNIMNKNEEKNIKDEEIDIEIEYFGTVKYNFRDDYLDIFDSIYNEFEEYIDKFIYLYMNGEDATDALCRLMVEIRSSIQGDIFENMEELKDFLSAGYDSPHMIGSKEELEKLTSINIQRYTNAISKLSKIIKIIQNIIDSIMEKSKENSIDNALEFSNYAKEVIKRFNVVINLATLITEQIQSYKPANKK